MEELKRPSRLISIDIMKGIGILGMLFSHAFFKGIWYTEGNAATVVGEHAPMVIPFALPLIIVGTWPGFFVLMTGILNAYLTAKRLERGRTMKQAVAPLYISAVLFLIIHIFMVVVLHDFRPDLHHEGQTTAGLFGNFLIGNGLIISQGQWYVHTMLSMLAFANIFFALTLSVFYKNNGWQSIGKTVRGLLLLTISIFIISALVSGPSYQLIIRLVKLNSIPGNILIFILQGLSASQLDMLPLAAYGCIGIITATYLLQDPRREDYSHLNKFLKTTGWISLSIGALLIILQIINSDSGSVDAIFIYEPYPVHLAVFNMGLILFVLNFALKKFEYAPIYKLEKICARTKFIRAAGILTLTLYVLEFPVRAFFTLTAHRLFGESSDYLKSITNFEFDQFMVNPGAIILFLVVIMGLWSLLIILLMKVKFKGSFEWLFAKTANIFRPDDKSHKADIEQILYPFRNLK